MKTTVLIVCESANGAKALPVARASGNKILADVARAAINEKRDEARRSCVINERLGRIANLEASELERVLSVLVPDLSVHLSEANPAVSFLM